MNEQAQAALAQQLKIAEAQVNYYTGQVAHSESLVALYKEHLEFTKKRADGIREALESVEK